MRTLLFILLFIPVLSFSQRFAISIDGGISTNTIPSNPAPPTYFSGGTNKEVLGTSFDIKASYFFRRTFEVGLGLNLVSLGYKNSLNFSDKEAGGLFDNTYIANTVIAAPAIPLYVFMNKNIKLGTGFFYYGFALGYAHTSAGNFKVQSFDEKIGGISNTRYVEYRQVYNDANGFYSAVSLGYTHKIKKGLFIYLEGSLKHLSLKTSDIGSYGVTYYPLCLGLQYRR